MYFRRSFVYPHRCTLPYQHAQHFQHLCKCVVFKTDRPVLRVLKLTPRQGTPMRVHKRPPDNDDNDNNNNIANNNNHNKQ